MVLHYELLFTKYKDCRIPSTQFTQSFFREDGLNILLDSFRLLCIAEFISRVQSESAIRLNALKNRIPELDPHGFQRPKNFS